MAAPCFDPWVSQAAPPSQSAGRAGKAHSGCTTLDPHAVVTSPVGQLAMGTSSSEKPPVPGRQQTILSLPDGAQTSSLAPERDRLLVLGLPEAVVRTMQEA